MATLIQLNKQVNKWVANLKKATQEYNYAHSVIYGYECGHPYVQAEHDRLLLAHYDVVIVRKRLEEAQNALKIAENAVECASAKVDYENTWKNEPTLWEAYVKK